MALNSTTLATLMGTKIAAAVVSNGGPLTDPSALLTALASAVVEHINASAEVDTVGALLIAPGGGGPCTGTAGIK